MRTLALIFLFLVHLTAGIRHDFDRPVFVFAHHPDLPISEYATGRLGIPAPEYARIYLYAAYRYLQDTPFTPREQAAYLRVWKIRGRFAAQEVDQTGAIAWSRIRATIPGFPLPIERAESRRITFARGFLSEDICADDAFASARETLRDRIRQFGLQSSAVAFWIKGQDRVLASCDPANVNLPEAAPANLPPLIKADREYQIAAALFYLQRFDEALERLRSIAKDANSPWRIWAPYLIGRTLLWQARFTQEDNVYFQKLDQAEAQFRAVLADRRLSPTHAGADRLLARCMLITHPASGMEKLASRLVKPQSFYTRESDLLMYLNAVDSFDHNEYNGKHIDKSSLPRDDFSLWWETLQSSQVQSYTRAVERWHRSRSKAWLYCAIAKARENSPEADALIEAALKIQMEQPGAPAMRYHAARLLALKGRFAEARSEIDLVLQASETLPSARNQTLNLKMQLVPSLAEMLRLSPRKVILASAEMDSDEFESRSKDASNGDPRAKAAARLASLDRLDAVGARAFSEKLPLDTLRGVALNAQSLPSYLLLELRLVVWTRAILLARFDVAREFAPLIAADHPQVAADMQSFLKAAGGRAAEIAAAYVLLKLPGARPYLAAGYGRQAPANLPDEWGRNWWYRFTPSDMYGIDLPYMWEFDSFGRDAASRLVVLPRLAFVTDVERQQSAREWQHLETSGERGRNWIAVRITEDVRDHPQRPNGGQILYSVIRAASVNPWSVHPEEDYPQTGLVAAYRLLSTRYPGSIWYRKVNEMQGLFLSQEK